VSPSILWLISFVVLQFFSFPPRYFKMLNTKFGALLLSFDAILIFWIFHKRTNYENCEHRFWAHGSFSACASPSGLKTYLISGRKLEPETQCGRSQVGLSDGDVAGAGLSSSGPQPRTPDLVSGGARAAEPLLSHQRPDGIGVSRKKQRVEGGTSRWIPPLFILWWFVLVYDCVCMTTGLWAL